MLINKSINIKNNFISMSFLLRAGTQGGFADITLYSPMDQTNIDPGKNCSLIVLNECYVS